MAREFGLTHFPDVNTALMEAGVKQRLGPYYEARCTCGNPRHSWTPGAEGWELDTSEREPSETRL